MSVNQSVGLLVSGLMVVGFNLVVPDIVGIGRRLARFDSIHFLMGLNFSRVHRRTNFDLRLARCDLNQLRYHEAERKLLTSALANRK